MIELNFKNNVTCQVCGKKLIVIDNYNYVTMICPKCHSTVFEEFDHTIHTIKHGVMKDGYDASMDIFYKQFIAYSLYAMNLSKSEYTNFWSEKKMIGLLLNEDIFAEGIYDYYVDRIQTFKMKQPCIYFKGYKKYLEMSEIEAEKFKKYL